ncbi:MAG: IS4 family transposase [Petrimonas sp.]|jgi:hypothetical protein|nr:IS4 family transposase [Petrimonas sp.]
MKNQKKPVKPAKSHYTFLRQIVQLIPRGLPGKIAEDHDADIREFTCLSHILSLLYGHFSKSSSLNEICDALRLHETDLARIRGARAPKRNTFSNANRTRSAEIAEELYWTMLKHFTCICPSFTQGGKYGGFISRIKRNIFAIDSTTLQLVMNCIDWARHRRRKAAAKTHMKLNVGCMLPSFAIVEDAAHHDSTRAEALCVSLKDGDILLADRAYVKFDFLYGLSARGVFFVLREKRNMKYTVVETASHKDRRIISDEIISLDVEETKNKYPEKLRRVTALVEVNGVEVEMTFITNNFKWSPRTVAELYRARWTIETFFKELKQTLQLSDFIGYNENAVKWQVWIGLLAHLIIRFLKHQSKWKLSFSRLAGTVRAALWMRVDLIQTLRIYGTADPPKRPLPFAEQLYFKGFEKFTSNPVGQPVC